MWKTREREREREREVESQAGYRDKFFTFNLKYNKVYRWNLTNDLQKYSLKKVKQKIMA